MADFFTSHTMVKKCLILTLLLSLSLKAQGPTIKTPTVTPKPTSTVYPWRKNITATIFWIGEKPTPKNPTPNHASSWDTKWQENFGGYDDPNNRAAVGYRPAAFVPKLNPFYIALPYNDRINHKYIKPEVPKVIPWYTPAKVKKGKSCLKGRWVQIYYNKKYCFAQWEDCGPFNTIDWPYVFGGKPPKNTSNKNAGIDLSPAIRDYLGLKSGAKVHWRFVDQPHVTPGPWLKYGKLSSVLTTKTETKTERYLREMRELRAIQEKERQRKLKEYLGN